VTTIELQNVTTTSDNTGTHLVQNKTPRQMRTVALFSDLTVTFFFELNRSINSKTGKFF